MKVLVTGGSGYLGTHVRRHFDGDDLSRNSGTSILNPYDVRSVEEYDLVIHLAAYLDKSPEAAEEVFLTNVEGTLNVLKNVRKGSTLIFASTKDVYGRFADNYAEVPESCPTHYAGQSPLEWSKLIAEHYVHYYAHQNDFRSCIFRLSTIYCEAAAGTSPGFVNAIAQAINLGEPISLPGGGSPIRDLLYVDDLSAACEAFFGSVIRHGTYNLGGGRSNAVSLLELVKRMEEVSGLQAVINSERPLPTPVPNRYVSDLSLVQHELDWQPKIGLDEGLSKLFR